MHTVEIDDFQYKARAINIEYDDWNNCIIAYLWYPKGTSPFEPRDDVWRIIRTRNKVHINLQSQKPEGY